VHRQRRIRPKRRREDIYGVGGLNTLHFKVKPTPTDGENILVVKYNEMPTKYVKDTVKSVLKGSVRGVVTGFRKINVYGGNIRKVSVEAENNIKNSWVMVGEVMNKAFKDISNVKRN